MLICCSETSYISLPKNHLDLQLDGTQIPCYPINHLFRSKLASMAERAKDTDFYDAIYLWKNHRNALNRGKLLKKKFNWPSVDNAGESFNEKVTINQVVQRAMAKATEKGKEQAVEMLNELKTWLKL